MRPLRSAALLALLVPAIAALVASCSPRITDRDGGNVPTPTPSPTPGGPTADAGPDRDVIAGLRVPLDGSASVGDTYLWEQTAGPALAIENGAQAIASVLVPPTATVATSYAFRLTVGDALGTSTDGMAVTLRAPVFVDFLAAITDAAEIDTTEGIDFEVAGLWVISTQGFASLFSSSGSFVMRRDVPGTPIGANFGADGLLYVGNAGNQALETLDTTTGMVATVENALDGGGAMGPCNYPLPDKDGNVFLSNRASGQVLRWDAAGQVMEIFLDAGQTGTNPNALAFGPEPDRLYVGNNDDVLRVPINANGTAGTPELYAEALGCEIDGLAFDAAGTLYAGCPGSQSLFVIPRSATLPIAPVRTFTNVGTGYSGFVSVTWGRGGFGETTLYWTNLGGRKVGRLDVGLPPLVPPLAP